MLHGLVQEQCSIKGNWGNGKKKKIHRVIVSTPKSLVFLFLNKSSRIVCLHQICPPVYRGANHHLFYGVATIYGNFAMIWSASSPSVPKVCMCTRRSPWTAVPVQPGPCSCGDLTLTDSRPDNSIHAPPASCQSKRPSRGYWRSCRPVWDVSVKAHPLCHRFSLHGRSAVRLPSVFQRSLSSFSPRLHCLPVFPPETWRPLNPWYNHRFLGSTFVILRPPGFCNGVFHTRSCRWLGSDIHVVFIASPQICVCPISTDCQSHQSILFSP